VADPNHNIFISYSRQDAAVVEQLASSLRDAGFLVWLDRWELMPGARWKNSIEEAIRAASAVIVCFGQSGTSQWQRGEYQTALELEALTDQSKVLIPILLPGADPQALPIDLSGRVWVDLRRGIDDKRGLSRLFAALQTIDTGNEIAREERTGDTLVEVGELTTAVSHFERALRIARATYGSRHPKIAGLLMKVAAGKQRVGDLVAARTLLEESLEISSSTWGRDSTEAASTLNNLASVLRDQGDLSAARMLFEEALAIDRRALGPEHPTVANRLNNLGSVLRDQGDLSAARTLFEEALAIDRRALGPGHPSVAITLNNLASLFVKSGATVDALRAYREAYTILSEILGPAHPWSRAVLTNLESINNDTS